MPSSINISGILGFNLKSRELYFVILVIGFALIYFMKKAEYHITDKNLSFGIFSNLPYSHLLLPSSVVTLESRSP